MFTSLCKKSIRDSLQLAVVALAAGSFLPGLLAYADTQYDRRQAAHELVQEALLREIDGQDEDRAALLEAAQNINPDDPSPFWHQGQVRYYNRWTPVEEVPQLAADNTWLIAYYHRRDDMANTLEGHLDLAHWCADHNLDAQARAHLFKVIEFNPNHAQTRAALGFVRMDNLWISEQDLEEAQADAEIASRALNQWASQIEAIRKSLHHRSLLRREGAAEKIAEIDDCSAIPALEAILAGDSEHAALLVINALNQMPQPDASLALARQAVFSPYENGRRAAAQCLADRSWDSFIPAMLSEMYTPIQSVASVGMQGGRLVYRHSFFREGQDAKDLRVFETDYRRVRLPDGDGLETFSRAWGDAEQMHQDREDRVAAQNAFTNRLNTRICEALTIITSKTLQNDPQSWWAWWNEHNEVYLAGSKSINRSIERESVEVYDRGDPLFGEESSSGGKITGAPPMDCLVAGTLVWTNRGALPVEAIQVGDLTLSQDPVSGELAYQPVIQTTQRPAGELVQVYAGNQMFECSGGHPFWVSGKGWVKARNLESGSQLHTARGTVQISSVETGSVQETFNLVVDDFHTYFIGDKMVLSHDNTVRESATTLVPGLPLE